MSLDNLYSYYIGLHDFLTSTTGKQLVEKLNQDIELQEQSLVSIISKIKTPEDYDNLKQEFLAKQNEIKALKTLAQNYLDDNSIQKEIKRLKTLLT